MMVSADRAATVDRINSYLFADRIVALTFLMRGFKTFLCRTCSAERRAVSEDPKAPTQDQPTSVILVQAGEFKVRGNDANESKDVF